MMKYKGLTLDKFQEEAIQAINHQHSVIVSAPTGAGKTLIAEYAIEKAVSNNKEIVYTAPIKALSNQKYRDFSKLYKNKVGILTGDVSLNPRSPILIMTTEIFRNVILTEPERLGQKEWVIFDEIHYLDDSQRGTVWEESLMLMPRHIKILALSATVPNINEIAEWIEQTHKIPIKIIKEANRPVPLKLNFQCNDQLFTNLKQMQNRNLTIADESKVRNKYYKNLIKNKPNRIETLFNHIKEKNLFPCIYFSFSRRKTESLAQDIASYNFLNKEEEKQITSLYQDLLKKFDMENERTAVYLYDLIKRGIAFHHAGLLPTLKEIIERLFTSRLLKVIFTTETFALGINMPARTVVFDELRKIYANYYRNLKTRDFYQMAGRAGRRGIDKHGFIFVKINPFMISEAELRNTIYGKTEKIYSQLRNNYATILNLYRDMKEDIYNIYPLSFHFYQSQKRKNKEQALGLLGDKIKLLKELNYITPDHRFSWKGELASRMYSYELPIGEIYQQGLLESLDTKQLAIVISALVYEPRKGQKNTPISKKIKSLSKDLNQITKRPHRLERKYKIYPQSKKFYFHLSKITELWFDGIKFHNLSKFTDIDEGEIVRYFRMNVQTLRELLSFEGFKIEFKTKVKQILQRINRDMVDAEKQLRQEI